MRNTERTDIYTRVTNEIVAAIEAGAGSWTMPWHHDGSATSRPVNAGTGKAYRGSNILSLWIAAQAAGYASGRWASYRQWRRLGAQVQRGAHDFARLVAVRLQSRHALADVGCQQLRFGHTQRARRVADLQLRLFRAQGGPAFRQSGWGRVCVCDQQAA